MTFEQEFLVRLAPIYLACRFPDAWGFASGPLAPIGHGLRLLRRGGLQGRDAAALCGGVTWSI